jgi:hypothetical protein
MSITNPKSGHVNRADIMLDSRPADMSGPAGLVMSGQTDLLATGLKESLGRGGDSGGYHAESGARVRYGCR